MLNGIRDFILRDFINDWYQTSVSADDTKFANHIKLTLDGVFQILVKRISCVPWLSFCRDHVMHPLRECLILYKNIIRDLSKQNPKWNELSEAERYGASSHLFLYIFLFTFSDGTAS